MLMMIIVAAVVNFGEAKWQSQNSNHTAGGSGVSRHQNPPPPTNIMHSSVQW
jgi:hypothetical protein